MATVQRYVNTGSTAGGDGTTNATSGSTRAYASLSEWEANSGGSATDDYIVDCCGSTADTTSVVVDFATNITTGSITIRSNTGEADGFYDGDAVISTSHYRLDPGNVASALNVSEQNTTINGLQIIAGHSSTFGNAIRKSAGATLNVLRCRLRNTSTTAYGIGQAGAALTWSTATSEYSNNLVVNFNTTGIDVNMANFSSGTVNLYHNTVYGDGSGVGINVLKSGASGSVTVNLKGNALANSGASNDLVVSMGSGTINYDANATEDYDLGTTGEVDLGTTTDAWTSPGTTSASDFTVKNSSSSLNVTVTGSLVSEDIRGTTRSNYSVGAFEFVSAGITHATSGAIAGAGSTVDGAAARMRAHAANGDLYGIGATLDGAAARTRLHPATGDIVGGGATVTGDAIRVVIVSHDSSGAIIGGGAAIEGVAARTGTSEHASSGDLIGGGSSIDGAAARHRAMTASGDIVGGGADIAGIAAIVKTHVTSGDLFGDGAVITGVVIRGGQVDLLYVAINARAAFVCVVNERGAYSCVVTARNAYSCSVSEAIVR